jgi:hypothetical protein
MQVAKSFWAVLLVGRYSRQLEVGVGMIRAQRDNFQKRLAGGSCVPRRQLMISKIVKQRS